MIRHQRHISLTMLRSSILLAIALLFLTGRNVTCVAAPTISYETQASELPHCTNNVVMEGQLEELNGDALGHDYPYNGAVNLTSSAQFHMSLKETTCLLMRSNRTLYNGFQMTLSMMHTIDFLRLEHHYAVNGKYRFGIPVISQKCKCDCAGGDSVCSLESYLYRNCSSGAVCYRTYQPFQSSQGCVMASTKSELCCQIQIDPYREWVFEALSLRQPDTVLVLRYRIFERTQNGGPSSSSASYSPRFPLSRRASAKMQRWKKNSDEVIEIPLNRGVAKFVFNKENLIQLVAASGRPHRQVEPGMYFQQLSGTAPPTPPSRSASPLRSDDFKELSLNAAQEDARLNAKDTLRHHHHVLRGGVPLNDLRESTLEKLGWLRLDADGRWSVRKGLVKLTQAQHINVQDCKAQKYTSTFNAEQYVLRSTPPPGAGGEPSEMEEIENYYLGRTVNEEAWVAGVEIGQRYVKIEHAEGSGLLLSVKTESQLRMVHHSSRFSDFNGTILLDADSKRYLNLTFFNARGTLIGQVYSSDARTAMDMVFSVETSDRGQVDYSYSASPSQSLAPEEPESSLLRRGGASKEVPMATTLFRTTVEASTSIQSKRLVCVHPASDYEAEICHWLPFIDSPLQQHFRIGSERWHFGHGECPGCNERGVDSFLAGLDPRNWLDGLNTPAELLTCALEVVLCLCAMLLSLMLCTKCVIPMGRCLASVSTPPKKK